jgi:pimeloyl-ACP methyl ester carboxylesterase
MLGVRKPVADLPKLPFKFWEVFQPPTPEEITAVRQNWHAQDARPRRMRVLMEEPLQIQGTRFYMRILEVAVGDTRQIGAILVPEGAARGKTPVLVEAKGVSWNFFPLQIPDGLNVAPILGKDLGRFVIVAPGFRGERVVVGKQSFQSDSPHESWDGAAEDLIAFLNVALETTPQADSKRICVFGRSRGGSVALLAAERDSRIGCVVSWAAPTDWFGLMAPAGWSQQQIAEDALRYHSKMNERGGQFIYNFLRYAVEGREQLADVRRRMLASSPLYFTSSLPATQVNYGIEDSIVPHRNGRELVKRAGNRIEAYFYPDAGHDQDLFEAPENARRFLLGYVK